MTSCLSTQLCVSRHQKPHFFNASSGTSHPLSHFINYTSHRAFLVVITSHDEPKSFHQVVQDPRWRDAMAKEISALETNDTWVLPLLCLENELWVVNGCAK